MSLHALAGHMATKGRGGDSLLVHMTPGEVQALQALAERNGGTLTINPETGQPEANFLKKILPMVAGFALGPAGFGLMSAGMAGAAVGGITALSTGSLSRGLMAGLGAYGGASLGGSLASAGEGALAAKELAGTLPAAPELAGLSSEAAAAATNNYASQVGAMRDAALSTAKDAGFGAKMSAGMGQMASNPGAYTREMMTGLATVSPMLADQGVQTATKRPDTGTIRNFTFDPYGQTYSDAGSYPASEYKGMAQGGIVALAEGGGLKLPEGWGVAGGKYDDPNEKISYFNQQGITPEQLLGSGKGVTQADIDWMQTTGGYNVPNSVKQVSNAPATTNLVLPEGWGTAGGAYDTAAEKIGYFNQNNIMPEQLLSSGQGVTQADIDWMRTQGRYAPDIGTYIAANPNLTYEDINKNITQLGLTPEQARAAMQKAGLSGAVQYAALNPNIGAASNVEETYGGLRGLSSNINYWLQTHPGASLNDFRNEMSKWLLDENDIKRATGKTSTELFTGPITTVYNPAEGASGSTGAGAVGGGTVVNPNGTITSSPRIPGIPEGGFTGMGQVRDAYTTGGGSLGYTNAAPKTMEEFDQRFNKQTGDSLAAYNYLMGKGANPVKSGVGEIMRPYSEAVRGVPAAEGRPTQRYIYDPVEKKYVENPNYRPMSYDTKGQRNVGMTSAEVLRGFNALPDKKDDTAIFDWVGENKVSIAQLAAAMGVSVAEAQRRMNAVGKKKGAAINSAGYIGDGGGGDGASGAAAGSSGSGDAAGDAAAAAADGAAAAAGDGAGPGTGAGWAYGGQVRRMALGGLGALAGGGQTGYNLGGYSDGGRLLKGPGDGVSDSIPATIGRNKRPARLADGEFVVPARIVSELGNGSTEAGARKLYAMMDRVQKARGRTTGKRRVAANTRSEKYLPA
jgi:hypothetical protein